MQTFEEYKVAARKKGGVPSKERIYNDAIDATIKELSQALGMSETTLRAMIKTEVKKWQL